MWTAFLGISWQNLIQRYCEILFLSYKLKYIKDLGTVLEHMVQEHCENEIPEEPFYNKSSMTTRLGKWLYLLSDNEANQTLPITLVLVKGHLAN